MVTGNGDSPWPGFRTAARLGPSLKASPCKEWPAAGTEGFVELAGAVTFVGEPSWAAMLTSVRELL